MFEYKYLNVSDCQDKSLPLCSNCLLLLISARLWHLIISSYLTIMNNTPHVHCVSHIKWFHYKNIMEQTSLQHRVVTEWTQ